MTRRIRTLLGAATTAVGLLATPAGAQKTKYPCRAPDLDSEEVREFLIRTDTSQSPAVIRELQMVELTRVPPDSIRLVSDPAVCRQAAAALLRSLGPDTQRIGVHVFRFGSAWIVNRPDGRGPPIVAIQDSTFRFKFGWGVTPPRGGGA